MATQQYEREKESGGPASVIVLGKGDLAIRIAEWFHQDDGHDLKMVVPVIPEPTWTGSLAGWARENGVALVESGRVEDIPGVMDDGWHIDLVFSTFYDRIFQAWFLDRCGRALNLHNAPLPRYRGVSPINWALKNEEPMHGVTIHEMTPGIDEGPIVAQLNYSIYPYFDEVVEVYQRALRYGWVLFEQSAPLFNRIEAVPQDESLATYYAAHQNTLLGDRRDFTRAQSIKRLQEIQPPLEDAGKAAD